MNYKEILIDSQKSGESALMTFLLQYHSYDNIVANFVEGQDYSYYRERIEEICDLAREDIIFFPCNGRKGVEIVKDMITENLHLPNNVKTLFFADSDYNIQEKRENIYYTDYYSIENFYCNRKTIEQVIQNILNINKYNPDFNTCMTLYDERYDKFRKEMIKVNAFCYAIRSKENELRVEEKTKINQIRIGKFIESRDFENFKMKDLNFERIKSIITSNIEITEEEYNKALNLIDETKMRGKWEIDFVTWFFRELNQCFHRGDLGLSENKEIDAEFGNRFMILASRFAETKETLRKYIENNLFDGV